MRGILLFLALTIGLFVSAQGYISCDNIFGSSLRDESGNRYGRGGMYMVSAGYNVALSAKMNERNQPTVWSASLYGTYAVLENDGAAKDMNPGSIVNAGVGLTHIRPISNKWSILASVGAGVYAPARELSCKSILGSGGVIFICRLNDNLSLGAGAGISNSFGIPMAMPMLYLNWRHGGRFDFHIDMSNTIKMSASTAIGRRLRLELTPLEVDGLTSVITVDGKSRIYSMMMLRSYLSPSFSFNDRLSVFAAVGANWVRGVDITERSLKAFFSSFKEEDDDPYFQSALRISAGVKFKF